MILGEKISGGSSWSRDDDIAFERGLAIYTDKTENRWEKIAAVVPGKTLEQIIEHYEILLHDVKLIESGRVPLPDYDFSEGSIGERGINRKCESKQEGKPKLKQKRRKGIAWTANEHRQFLLGLEKYGKGDWRSISRSFVVTRTPTQVASHAQKYFERLNSKNKNKKRPSIHDVSVAESTNVSTKQRPITWQNTRPTSQPSLDHHTYGTPTIWNIPATSQPYHHLPIYGTPTMWNTQAASQPSINIPMHGTPTIGQSMVGLGPMVLPFGSDMNRLAAPHMAYGVQRHSVPYSTVPSAPMNIPYNMTYIPNSFS